MQITALSASTVGADRSGPARAPSAVGAVAVAATPAQDAVEAGAPAPARAGLRAWDPQLQTQVADAQQAIDFLDRAAHHLQGLKSDVSGRLAGRPVDDERIAARTRQFTATWNSRAQATGGSLGPQLQFSSPAPAPQHFSVRGLDLHRLQAGDAEVLAFSVGGGARAPMTVQIEPGLAPEAIVQRLGQALAPASIGVSRGEGGALVLGVAEAAWPSVRDTLSVRGGGIRFPTGQPVRVKTDAQPPAIQPETWQGGGVAQLRRTLAQVVDASDRVRQRRDAVDRTLTATGAGAASEPPAAADAVAAATFAQDFVAAISQPGYALSRPFHRP
jgi:hypothetical protein